jgi:hypothetical protein
MRSYLPTLLSLLAVSIVGCGAPAADADVSTDTAAYSTDPLTGDELAFEKFMHDDVSSNGWPAHDYACKSVETTTADGKRIWIHAYLYLERDRTFTIFYAETEMVSQFGGHARTQRKLTGDWTANGTSLALGAASAKLGRGNDFWGDPTDAVIMTLPSGWQSADVRDVVLAAIPCSSNVGPSAPFFEDYR